MPENHFIVAARGPGSEVYIFDLSKNPSFPDKDSTFCPQAVCIGHTAEGYALEWSSLSSGHLLTGSEDNTVQLWDINSTKMKNAQNGTQIKPLCAFKAHTEIVEDVDWHPKEKNMFASVGDDCVVNLWDTRKTKPTNSLKEAHGADINGISFNPAQEYLFATGSADKTVKLWDMRTLKPYVI